MARRTKEEAEQTRKDILLTALDMFCEKGYTRTTLDDIAKSYPSNSGRIISIIDVDATVYTYSDYVVFIP